MSEPLDIPAPSAQLQAALAKMGPVRTRRPLVTVAVLLSVAVAWAGLGLGVTHLRPDFAAMPALWLASLAAVWLLAFVAPFWWLAMPPRASVLPAVHRAVVPAVVGALLLGGLLAATQLGWPEGTEVPRERLVGLGISCFTFGTLIAVIPLVVAAFVLRRLLPVGAARAGAVCGLGAGALGAVLLELHCAAGGMHPLYSHGACILVGAALGAALFRLLSR